jgi:Ca-activated chloride channel homolog
MISTTTMANPNHQTSGGRLVIPQGTLPLVGTTIDAQARGGLCRVVLRQRFCNPHQEPLSATYSLPVPEDAAVSGFSFTLGDRRIVGEIDRKASARQRFEDAILEGRTAALLDEKRSTVFSQEIGNIPPGAELDVEIEIDQRLRWLEEGQWELRIPTTVAPRYLGVEGRVPDADAIHQDVVDGSTGIQLSLVLAVLDALDGGRGPSSPSHRIVTTSSGEAVRVGFAEETAPLDRDVVVRWQASGQQVGAQLTLADAASVPGRSFGLLTLVPPSPSASKQPVARDLVLLLDTSGSMSGAPLAQAKRVASTLVASLTKRDTLEMVQFSWSARRWNKKPVRMDKQGRQDALAWIQKLSASGGTEMRDGILAALRGVNAESQRQVVLVTDGLIGFEREIVSTILRKLPAGSRVHSVGVGSGVNRTLTAGASRAGKGIEVILGIGEDAEPAAARLDARTKAPVVVDLELEGSALLQHAPARLPDLFQGAPACIGLELTPAGGKLRIKGRTADGPWSTTLDVPPAPNNGSPAVAKLFGRERVNDLEMNIAAGESGNWDKEIERVGLVFQVATKMTSWVAIDEQVSVDPDAPTRRQKVPQQLPHGMSVEGLGLRSAQPMPMRASLGMAVMAEMAVPAAPAAGGFMARGGKRAKMEKKAKVDLTARLGSRATPAPGAPPPPPAPAMPSAKSRVRRAADVVRDFFGGKSDDAKGAPPAEIELADMEEREASFEDSLRTPDDIIRILLGRVVALDEKKLVVELTVTHEALDWVRPDTVELVWADGSRIRAKVKQGTRTGRIAEGTTLRLVVDLTASGLLRSEAPAAIHVVTDQGVVAIELG